MQDTQSNKGLIFGIIAITVLVFAGMVWLVMQAPSNGNSVTPGKDERVSFADGTSPRIGLPNAKVVVHLYSDFQCPACKLAEPGVTHAIQTFRNQVLFVWKDFPLSQIHKNATVAAAAARCAQDQNKFWEFHDRLYETQEAWSGKADPKDDFIASATALSLDVGRFTDCLSNGGKNGVVANDYAEGLSNGVDRTPTVFINKQRFFGMSPTEWDTAIRAALAAVPSDATSTR